jgi:hypothetical protein
LKNKRSASGMVRLGRTGVPDLPFSGGETKMVALLQNE